MKKHSKEINRQLSELSGKAYQRELEAILSSLEMEFTKWREKQIDCWKLVDLIHKFHNQDSREIYKRYEMDTNKELNVAYALNNEILKRNEVPDMVLDAIGNLVEIGEK